MVIIVGILLKIKILWICICFSNKLEKCVQKKKQNRVCCFNKVQCSPMQEDGSHVNECTGTKSIMVVIL